MKMTKPVLSIFAITFVVAVAILIIGNFMQIKPMPGGGIGSGFLIGIYFPVKIPSGIPRIPVRIVCVCAGVLAAIAAYYLFLLF